MIICWHSDQHVLTHGFKWLWHGHITAVVAGSYPKIYAVTEVGVRFNTELGSRLISELGRKSINETGDRFNAESSHKYIEEN